VLAGEFFLYDVVSSTIILLSYTNLGNKIPTKNDLLRYKIDRTSCFQFEVQTKLCFFFMVTFKVYLCCIVQIYLKTTFSPMKYTNQIVCIFNILKFFYPSLSIGILF